MLGRPDRVPQRVHGPQRAVGISVAPMFCQRGSYENRRWSYEREPFVFGRMELDDATAQVGRHVPWRPFRAADSELS